MEADFSAALTAILSSAGVVALAKAIGGWASKRQASKDELERIELEHRLQAEEAERAAKILEESRSDERLDGIRDTFRLVSLMNDILVTAEALQVVLLMTHNSGEPIRPGIKLYSSVLHEIRRHGWSLTKDWQGQRLGDWYLGMLERLVQDGACSVSRDEIPAGVPLRDTYERLGISHSRVMYVHASADARSIYYVSIAADSPMEWDATQRDLVRGRVGAMARILAEHEIPMGE